MSTISATIKEMIRQQLLTLHTCLICTVLNVYDDGNAKVHPLTMVQTVSGEVRQHQALDHVPMTDQVRDYVSVGSICVVIFAGQHRIIDINRDKKTKTPSKKS